MKKLYIRLTTLILMFLCIFSLLLYICLTYNKSEYTEKTIVEQQLLEERNEIEEICINVVNLYNQQLINYYAEPTEKNKEMANKTAEAYNNYFEEKKYIWRGNVPSYIVKHLEIIE